MNIVTGIKDYLKELVRLGEIVREGIRMPSYTYDDSAGTGYIYYCYAGENDIELSDSKWKIERELDAPLGVVNSLMYPGNKDYTHKATDLATVAGYTYIFLK